MLERAQRAWTKSKLAWLMLVIIQCCGAGLAVWVTWARPEHGAVAIALPIVGLVVPVVTYLLRSRASAAYASGEAWRRVFLLNDSLGYQPSAAEYASLLLDASEAGPNFERKPMGNYYASELSPGYSRLLENLSESTFYTTRLARIMARLCGAAVAVGIAAFVLVITGVLAAPLLASPEAGTWLAEFGPRIATVASSVIAFFAAGQLIELALAYAKLAAASRAVLDRAIDPRQEDLSEGAILSLLGSYESALAAAAVPIPDLLARMSATELNAEWAAIRARRARLRQALPSGEQVGP